MANSELVEQALSILMALGMPREQQNDRTAMCLLALLDLYDNETWDQAKNPTLGIRGILDFIRNKMKVPYAENTRETIRDESIKPMVAAGILIKNPDTPQRAVNSPATIYQIRAETLDLLKKFGEVNWNSLLIEYLGSRQTLVERYARRREGLLLRIKDGENDIRLSPGSHSQLIKQILEEFAPRFARNTSILYVGDTGDKWGLFEIDKLTELGVEVSKHGQMPDVLLYDREKNWLFLIESVTSNGPIDSRRYEELTRLFAGSSANLVFVTAFPDRRIMRKYLSVLAWETEVWVADAPDHLIHFNGDKFLGPREPSSAD
jgi:hypothetical protein